MRLSPQRSPQQGYTPLVSLLSHSSSSRHSSWPFRIFQGTTREVSRSHRRLSGMVPVHNCAIRRSNAFFNRFLGAWLRKPSNLENAHSGRLMILFQTRLGRSPIASLGVQCAACATLASCVGPVWDHHYPRHRLWLDRSVHELELDANPLVRLVTTWEPNAFSCGEFSAGAPASRCMPLDEALLQSAFLHTSPFFSSFS